MALTKANTVFTSASTVILDTSYVLERGRNYTSTFTSDTRSRENLTVIRRCMAANV